MSNRDPYSDYRLVSSVIILRFCQSMRTFCGRLTHTLRGNVGMLLGGHGTLQQI
jgi:hypothetical protein